MVSATHQSGHPLNQFQMLRVWHIYCTYINWVIFEVNVLEYDMEHLGMRNVKDLVVVSKLVS